MGRRSKGTDEHRNTKKHLVINFTKLNPTTIVDKYSISNIIVILSNMGTANDFTMLDLMFRFHQIPLVERDREKLSVVNGKYEFF